MLMLQHNSSHNKMSISAKCTKLLLLCALCVHYTNQPAASYDPEHTQNQYHNVQRHSRSHQQQHQHHQQQQQQTQNQQQSQISYLTSRDLSSSQTSDGEFIVPVVEDPYGCPLECHCNKIAQIADCSNRNLTRVPATFPKDIKRIRLERNNITEIGPYAFQGLKRLQRIDLSNNNLYRIDTLAFAGGLQALNSIILYSNKLEHLPVNVFNELNQLQLLLLNANSLQTIHKDLFQSLANLNLLSLYDNNIATLTAGTFDGLKSIKTIHLGKNPLNCDCNLRWLVDYFEANPVETSEARCELPTRTQGKKLSQLSRNELKCPESQPSKTVNLQPLHQQQQQQQQQQTNNDQSSSCPAGCICNGSTVDCSRASSPPSESRSGGGAGTYELPDIPDDVPVYVARVHINDNRIKKIRQTGIFRRLANSQKLDLGNNKIIDIEDNAINGQFANGQKPERVVFVLLENQHCDAAGATAAANTRTQNEQQPSLQQRQPFNGRPANRQQILFDDPCTMAPKVNDPQYDSPCFNGGVCRPLSGQGHLANYTCTCPAGFAGPLCEANIDDCVDHQCQNGAMCVDGINSYKCICRDPTTTGEYCEQLNAASGSSSYATNSANSIAPLALPIIAAASGASSMSPVIQSVAPSGPTYEVSTMASAPLYSSPTRESQQILARSADYLRVPDDLASNSLHTSGNNHQLQPTSLVPTQQEGGCQRITQRKYLDDGNGCQSVRVLKISECSGPCGQSYGGGSGAAAASAGCCLPAKVKRRRIRMQCSDGASYVKTIDLIKKCACTNDASCPAYDPVTPMPPTTPVPGKGQRNGNMGMLSSQSSSNNNYYKYLSSQQQQQQQQQPVRRNSSPMFNVTQEDQLLQITRLDAVD